jgi:hypothetical protein
MKTFKIYSLGVSRLAIRHARRMPNWSWRVLTLSLNALCLAVLIRGVVAPLMIEAQFLLSQMPGLGRTAEIAPEPSAQRAELTRKIKQLCESMRGGLSSTPLILNPSATFLRIREVAVESGASVLSFSGPEARVVGADERTFTIVFSATFTNIVMLFERLGGLSEALELSSWSIERSDNATEGLRLEAHFRFNPLEFPKECRDSSSGHDVLKSPAR